VAGSEKVEEAAAARPAAQLPARVSPFIRKPAVFVSFVTLGFKNFAWSYHSDYASDA
jgi:hypothetical protein